MYGHPALQYHEVSKLSPGAIVEHKDLPGVALVIISGPERGLRGDVYKVRRPDGKVVPALRENLRI